MPPTALTGTPNTGAAAPSRAAGAVALALLLVAAVGARLRRRMRD